jgi:C-terminal processing protease CtpA/Prc
MKARAPSRRATRAIRASRGPPTHAEAKVIRYVGVAALASLAIARVSPAQGTQRDSIEASRLAGLARVWSAVRFRHPWTAYRDDLNVDSAAVAAIAAVQAARTTAEFERAIAGVVKPLGDPVTRVVPARPDALPNRWPTGATREQTTQLRPDGTLIIGLHRYADVSDAAADLGDSRRGVAESVGRLSAARAVVLDLRTDDPTPRNRDNTHDFRAVVESMLRRMTTRTVTPPSERNVFRRGFYPESPVDGKVITPSTTVVQPSAMVRPDSGARALPVVIIVNEHSELPLYAAGLLGDGLAALVSEGALGDAPYVDDLYVDAGEGVKVRVRTSEVVDSANRAVAPPAAVVSRGVPGGADPAMVRALALLREPWPRRPVAGARLPQYVVQRPAQAASGTLPSREERIFAAIKFWGVITTFYPAIELRGRPWSEALAEFVPEMRDASTVIEYHLALARMTARFEDSHAVLNTPELQEWRGPAALPLHADLIDGRIVVTKVAADSLLGGSGIRPGDIIRTIDGEDAVARGRRLASTMSASSQGRTDLDAAMVGRRGPRGSTAVLVIEDGAGQTRTVRVRRIPLAMVNPSIMGGMPAAVRMVAPDIGFIDPWRIPVDSVDAAFDALRDARAIILDWREGSGTTYPFVARIARSDSTPNSVTSPFIGSLGGSWRHTDGAITRMAWCVCRDANRTYPGRVVILIGPRPQSSMEVNGQLAKNSAGAVFVGRPTSGTIGGTTYMYVPGGIRLTFTSGNGPDRKGLQPDVPVRVTIAGLRAGRDEVLEAAIAHLRRELR